MVADDSKKAPAQTLNPSNTVDIIEIAPDQLIPTMEQLTARHMRLVQMHCTKLQSGEFQVNYSCNENYKLTTVRLTVPEAATLPSISGIFHPAFLYENEIHDLFGLRFSGMRIDFHGNLFKTAVKTPFNNPETEEKK